MLFVNANVSLRLKDANFPAQVTCPCLSGEGAGWGGGVPDWKHLKNLMECDRGVVRDIQGRQQRENFVLHFLKSRTF